MKALKKEKLEKIGLILLLSLGLAYAYVTLLFLPQWTVIQSSTKQLQTQDNLYQELISYQGNPSRLQQEIKTLENQVQKLSAELPNRVDKPQLMVGLYTLAKKHSVNPQSIAFEQPQTKGDYQEIGISFSCLGKVDDILATIKDLQFGGTQRLAIGSIALSTQQGTMRADLKLTAYAARGTSERVEKPDFMNTPIGVDSPAKMFQP